MTRLDSGAGGAGLEVTVAIASRDRPLRLRWLLNSLRAQTFPADRFEVVVAHDSFSPEVQGLLDSHPLRATGQLRAFRLAAGTLLAGAKRNIAWREAKSPLVLFTDDDCRASPQWIEQTVAAARAHPGAILQGRTVPDPDENATLLGAPWAHTVLIEPPSPWAETCNIAYPRELLERANGFCEQVRVGEDTDLALRASGLGARLVAVPGMLVYHAVEERSLSAAVRSMGRWGDAAWLAKRHPGVRRDMWGGIWWLPEHAALSAGLLGGALWRRRSSAALLGLPWLALSLRHRGYGPRGILRSISELPGRAVIDGAGVLVLARASIRYRTLLL